ncbi:MAG: ComF family protein [Candidatus Onthomonas sp.]
MAPTFPIRLAAGLLELLYPPRCAFCTQVLEPGSPSSGICPDCASTLPRTGPSTVAQDGDCFSKCLSPLFYQSAAAQSIRRYKFSGKACYHHAYGPLLRSCLSHNLSQPPDLITWAPLNRWRKYRRGYDQALLLAREAGALWAQDPVPLLEKIRNTRPQSSLSAAKRRQNVRGVYRLIRGCPSLEGKRILLVDDVITTGSTLSACAAVLTAAGAEEVICLTLARAGVDRSESDG